VQVRAIGRKREREREREGPNALVGLFTIPSGSFSNEISDESARVAA